MYIKCKICNRDIIKNPGRGRPNLIVCSGCKVKLSNITYDKLFRWNKEFKDTLNENNNRY